ncbi:MAG: tagatose-bisphosphate aldolase [Clostridiales bacterium]|nr:tagatose-bisphosphate aldolase [Clostridiales bacterium]
MLRVNRLAQGDPARRFLPAYHFDICYPDGTAIGNCDLRVGHNGKTYLGGNIGYTVFPPCRGHHYAAKACRILFGFAKEHGMKYIIITCFPENTPSRRTLEGLNGKMLEIAPLPEDNEMYREGHREVCVFRFDLA